MEARTFRDLVAWQKAMDLVVAVYRITQAWPRDKLFGLTSQIRRPAVSVPANLAEGQGRSGSREFFHYLSIAPGSFSELETHLLIAHRLDYLPESGLAALMSQLEAVRRLLRGLIRSLRSTESKSLLTPDS